MMSLLWIACVLVLPLAKADQGCIVTPWSEWGPCEATKACGSQARLAAARSFTSNPPIQDIGRSRMATMVETKTREWTREATCRDEEDCPVYMDRPSDRSQPCVDGNAGDLPCWNIDQLSFLNIWDLGYEQHPVKEDYLRHGNDIWGWFDPETGDEYAIIGLTGATSFVRVTDPENPVPVGFIETATTPSIWRDIKVIGNYAYIVSEAWEHGLQVFDLTELRGRQTLQLDTPTATYGGDVGFGHAHNVVANEETGYIYVVGSHWPRETTCNGGLYVLNVQDPLNPVFEGCFGDDGYTHDAQCIVYRGPDVTYQGHEICFCYNENTVTIVDVTDKANMTLVSRKGYNYARYTHQGWITEDHTLVLMDDELDEMLTDIKLTRTHMWDVTDLDDPVLRTTFTHNVLSIDHNQYILGDFTFQANYQAGLRILHIERDGELPDLQLVGYFDVFPSSTKSEFNGLWSVYPFFPSGNLVLSSIEYGLFVVRPNWDAIRAELGTADIHAERSRSRDLIQKDSGASCPPLVDTQPCHSNTRC